MMITIMIMTIVVIIIMIIIVIMKMMIMMIMMITIIIMIMTLIIMCYYSILYDEPTFCQPRSQGPDSTAQAAYLRRIRPAYW